MLMFKEMWRQFPVVFRILWGIGLVFSFTFMALLIVIGFKIMLRL